MEKSESCWILLTWLSVRVDELATAIFIVILRYMEVPVRPSYSHGKAARRDFNISPSFTTVFRYFNAVAYLFVYHSLAFSFT